MVLVCDICDAMGQRVEADGSITNIGEAKSDVEILAAFFAGPDLSAAPRSPRDCLPVDLPESAVVEVLELLASGELKFDGYGFFFEDRYGVVPMRF